MSINQLNNPNNLNYPIDTDVQVSLRMLMNQHQEAGTRMEPELVTLIHPHKPQNLVKLMSNIPLTIVSSVIIFLF